MSVTTSLLQLWLKQTSFIILQHNSTGISTCPIKWLHSLISNRWWSLHSYFLGTVASFTYRVYQDVCCHLMARTCKCKWLLDICTWRRFYKTEMCPSTGSFVIGTMKWSRKIRKILISLVVIFDLSGVLNLPPTDNDRLHVDTVTGVFTCWKQIKKAFHVGGDKCVMR